LWGDCDRRPFGTFACGERDRRAPLAAGLVVLVEQLLDATVFFGEQHGGIAERVALDRRLAEIRGRGDRGGQQARGQDPSRLSLRRRRRREREQAAEQEGET